MALPRGIRGGRGVVAVAGFVNFVTTPLAIAPPANADVLDSIIEVMVDSVAGLDHAVAVEVSSPGASAAVSLDTLLHTLEQDWILSPTGIDLDTSINTAWRDLGGSGIVIGNGANGAEDGTLAQATGGAGGLLFGDGGNGATDAAGQGGPGGPAGLFGNGGQGGAGASAPAAGMVGGQGGAGGTGGMVLGDGGAGGNGGDGSIGGAGGDGGNAVGLLGTGGAGGNGGDGTNPDGLPALGGAGGHAGLFGSHGAVGHFGTVTNLPSSTNPQAPTAGTDDGLASPITTTGPWLIDSAGKVVILHGLNVGTLSNADAAFLADHGFNAVRLSIAWDDVEPEPGVFNTAYLASIEKTVKMLANYGIYTDLVMSQGLYSSTFGGGSAPTWAVQTGGLPNIQAGFPLTYVVDPAENYAWDAFWSNAPGPDGVGLENQYALTLEHVAAYFNGNPDVVGIEIMNEPWPGSLWLPTLLGSPAFGAQELTPFYDQAAEAIRAVDPTTPVYFEPSSFFDYGVDTHLGTVDVSHTVFAFHDYCAPNLAGLGIFDAVCPAELALVVDEAGAYAQAHQIPALLTEFGSTDDLNILDTTIQSANQNQIGWLEYDFSDLVLNSNLPPSGANVDPAELATLAQPYPQVVAGTPNSWSFDSHTGIFQFSYSTEKASGLGSFAPGSTTIVSVPAVEFPNGYQVSVTGGDVVSAPDAPQLVIASDGDTDTIDVTVGPTAG